MRGYEDVRGGGEIWERDADIKRYKDGLFT